MYIPLQVAKCLVEVPDCFQVKFLPNRVLHQKSCFRFGHQQIAAAAGGWHGRSQLSATTCKPLSSSETWESVMQTGNICFQSKSCSIKSHSDKV